MSTHWTLARRAAKMNPSVIRKILKIAERPGVVSLAGGLPSPKTFPIKGTLYKAQCQAMLSALETDMQGLGVEWNSPAVGMFLWLRLPEGMTATDLLPRAIEHGVAFVPGNAFYAEQPGPRTLRLSFVTASEDQIRTGIAALARAVRSMVVANAVETV